MKSYIEEEIIKTLFETVFYLFWGNTEQWNMVKVTSQQSNAIQKLVTRYLTSFICQVITVNHLSIAGTIL